MRSKKEDPASSQQECLGPAPLLGGVVPLPHTSGVSWPLLPLILFYNVLLFFSTVRTLLGSWAVCAMKSDFIALCCYDHIWGAGGGSRRAGACMTALYFNGIPAGHTLSRAPSPRGPHHGHGAVREKKTVILEPEEKARPLPPQRRAQTRQPRKKPEPQQQGPSVRMMWKCAVLDEPRTRACHPRVGDLSHCSLAKLQSMIGKARMEMNLLCAELSWAT